jgi:hypothetical protein
MDTLKTLAIASEANMSAYGKVISGGAQMSKGLTKGINDKLDGIADRRERAQVIATSVVNAYKVKTLSDQHTQNQNGGKFTTPKVPTKV